MLVLKYKELSKKMVRKKLSLSMNGLDTIGRLKPIIPTRDIISLINKVKELAESYGEVCAQNIDDIKHQS